MQSSDTDETATDNGGQSEDGFHCAAETTIDVLAGKWRLMVIFWLLQSPLRFNALQRRLGAITHRTLSKTLKAMEADGLLVRNDHQEVPPRVDYALTKKGRSLEPILVAMQRWAEENKNKDKD